jgi:hypothetical protein
METLPARITNPALLDLAGAILAAHPTPESTAALRPRLYAPDLSWADLIAFAAAQDILPPLIWALQTRFLLLPAPKTLNPEQRAAFITTRLNDAYAAHEARQADLRDQLHACLAALNEAGITPILLKGCRYLPEPGSHWGSARPMRDIDLLIKPDHAAAAVNALTGIGYVADAATGLQHQHLPELRLAGHHGLVELHTDALAPAGAKFLATVLVWEKAEPINLAGNAALALPPAWQALHAMLHHQASDDGYNQHILALKPLWEFACLTSTLEAPAWEQLCQQMALHEGAALLASWCLQARQVFGLRQPLGVPVSTAALAQAAACFDEAAQPQLLRRARFIWRQLRRGFSSEMLSLRYGKPPGEVGLALRARHLWFLLRRYRGHLGARLLGHS